MKQFRHFILGCKCQIVTDHRPLQWLQNHSDNPRLCRWSLLLQEYDFDIIYRPGKCNQAANALSRQVCTINVWFPLTNKEISQSQENDHTLKLVRKFLQSNQIPNEKELPGYDGKVFRRNWCDVKDEDGLLKLRTVDPSMKTTKYVVIVGKPLQKKVVAQFHDAVTAGHLGFEKTLKRCKEEAYWPGMRQDIYTYCKACTKCQEVKMRKHSPPLQNISIGKPWSLVGVDVLEVPCNRWGERYLVVFQDYFTKWPEVYVTKDQKAEKCVLNLISRFGPPDQIHSDQGPNFESSLLKGTLEFFGIKKSHTTPYHPQGNGLVERMNRSPLSTYYDASSRRIKTGTKYWIKPYLRIELLPIAPRGSHHSR